MNFINKYENEKTTILNVTKIFCYDVTDLSDECELVIVKLGTN